MSVKSRIGTIVLRLRIEHAKQRARAQRRAHESIERHVLAPYGFNVTNRSRGTTPRERPENNLRMPTAFSRLTI